MPRLFEGESRNLPIETHSDRNAGSARRVTLVVTSLASIGTPSDTGRLGSASSR